MISGEIWLLLLNLIYQLINLKQPFELFGGNLCNLGEIDFLYLKLNQQANDILEILALCISHGLTTFSQFDGLLTFLKVYMENVKLRKPISSISIYRKNSIFCQLSLLLINWCILSITTTKSLRWVISQTSSDWVCHESMSQMRTERAAQERRICKLTAQVKTHDCIEGIKGLS